MTEIHAIDYRVKFRANSHFCSQLHNTGGIGIVVAYIKGDLLLANYLSGRIIQLLKIKPRKQTYKPGVFHDIYKRILNHQVDI